MRWTIGRMRSAIGTRRPRVGAAFTLPALAAACLSAAAIKPGKYNVVGALRARASDHKPSRPAPSGFHDTSIGDSIDLLEMCSRTNPSVSMRPW
ncbi:hypothetical protein [Nocardioides aromaticivorans]|uniref:hypothetical protein n=1 Tax=Nocardioides aromaticivorans TaxID=200618 RepID=UPI001A8C9C40|nr:hypothetical protein [Nocardioides aromaticivorans]